ncbi:MAG: GEVED domain-containing protein, partial [Flavobacteriales bacterium]
MMNYVYALGSGIGSPPTDRDLVALLGRGSSLLKAGFLSLVLAVVGVQAQAQISDYSFTPTTGTYTEIPSGAPAVDLASVRADGNLSAAQSIGFSFVLDGVPYTTFRMSSNGFITLGTGGPGGSANANNLAAGTNPARPYIAPLWDDLDGNVTGSVARYITTGTAPNRVLTVEWRNWQWNWSAIGNTISFQCMLFETTNVIEFIYRQEAGAVNNTTSGASIGISGVSTGAGNYLSLNGTGASPTASSTTETNNLNTKPATGQIYRFTPPVPCTSLPSLAGGTASASVTSGCVSVSTSNLSVTGATGGAAGLTFQWRSGPVGGPYTTLLGTAATQTVTGVTSTTAYVRDIICSGGPATATSSEVVITVNALPNVTATAANGGNFCGTGELTASGASTYSWSPAAQLLSSTGSSVTSIATANTTFTVTGTDGAGCQNTATVSITYTAPSEVTLTATPSSFCGSGGTSVLSATSANPNYTYTWTALDGAVISNVQPMSVDAAVTQTSGFQLTASDAGTGCSVVQFQSVGVYPLPAATMSITPNTPQCPGAPLTINSGLSSGNFSSASIPHAPLTAPGTATVLATGGAAVVPQTSGSLDDGGWGDIPIGFTFNFFGTPYSTCNVGTNGTIMFGTYNGGGLADFTFTTLPSTSEPLGMVAVLAMDNQLTTSGGQNGRLQYWTEGIAPNRRFVVQYLNVREFGDVLVSTAQAIFYETTGVVEVHVTSSTNVDRNKLVGINGPDGTIGVLAFASGTTVSANNPISTPFAYRFSPPSNYTTTWTIGGTAQTPGSNQFTLSDSPSASTTYSISYTNTTSGCTNAPGSAEITYTPGTPVNDATFSPAAPVVCAGTPSVLTVNPAGGVGTLSYQWLDPLNAPVGTNSNQLTVTQGGTYSVIITDNCTSITRTVTVTANGGPVTITASVPNFCGTGGETTLTASSSYPNYAYTWASTGTGTLSTTTGAVTVATVTESSGFELIATDLAGSCNQTLTTVVPVLPLPTTTMSFTPGLPQCPGATIAVNSGLSALNFTSNSIPHAPLAAPPSATVLATAGAAVVPQTSGSLDDGGWGDVPIGFTFNFFGTPFTTCNVGTNGTIMFGAYSAGGLSDFTFTTLPNTFEPLGMVAVLAMDNNLTTSGGQDGTIRYWTEGSAPNRRFVVQYLNVREHADVFVSTSQAIFYENTGDVDVHVTSSTNVDRNKLVGINGPDGTIGVLAYASGTTPSANNPISTPFAYRFSPPGNFSTTWSIGGVAQTPGVNEFSINVSPTTTTQYSISYTNLVTGCTNAPGSAQITYTPGTPITAGTISPASPTVCPGGSVVLTAAPTDGVAPHTYQWRDPSAALLGTSATQSATQVGTYEVDITDACGNTITVSVNVSPINDPCVCNAYCVPVSSGSACLTQVSLHTLSNSTAGCAAGNYSFQSATASVAQGISYTLSLTTDGDAITSVWFDWDADGQLEASEWTQVFTTGTTGSVSISVPIDAVPGSTRMRVRSRLSGNSNGSGDACSTFGSGECEDYCIAVVAAPSCSGTPTPGATTASASVVCPGNSLTLSVTNTPPLTGLSYIWQSSTTGSAGPWSTMATNTSGSYTVSSQSVNTWYRARVNCTSSGQTGVATPVQVTMSAFCYPAPVAPTSSVDTDIAQVSVGAGTSNTACGNTAPGAGSVAGIYSSFLNQPALTSLVRGGSAPFSVTRQQCGSFGPYDSNVAIYIDLNQNGQFEDTEEVFDNGSLVFATTPITGSISIPLTATLGLTGMRVIAAESSTDITPSTTFTWGEVEDYVVNIVAPAVANDFPSFAVNVTTGAFPTCSASQTVNLALASDSPETAGSGNDAWYAFTAQTNA